MYGERGRGGGSDRETGTARIERELERRLKQARYPGNAWRQDERLKTIAGDAVSFAPPPTPKPSTTSRTGRGGANLQMGRWVRKPEEDIGRPISGGLVDFRQTDDGGRTMGDQTLEEVG